MDKKQMQRDDLAGSHPLPTVALKDAVKTYPGPPAVEALKKTSVEIYAGERIAIVGPSGSGKSTLLSILGTLDSPSSGEVYIDGTAVSELREWEKTALRAQRLGFVFQQFHLVPGLTAVENVELGLLYSQTPPAQRRERAQSALERVGLEDRMEHRPYELSGGQQQRVALARALVRNPGVLFADEPTGALDTNTGAAVMEMLLGTTKTGTSLVVVTHDQALANQFDRQIHVRDGEIVSDEKKDTPVPSKEDTREDKKEQR